eukprot:768351-Hanusia_phi.AAC.19
MKRIISQEQRAKVLSSLYDQGLGHMDQMQKVQLQVKAEIPTDHKQFKQVNALKEKIQRHIVNVHLASNFVFECHKMAELRSRNATASFDIMIVIVLQNMQVGNFSRIGSRSKTCISGGTSFVTFRIFDMFSIDHVFLMAEVRTTEAKLAEQILQYMLSGILQNLPTCMGEMEGDEEEERKISSNVFLVLSCERMEPSSKHERETL